MMDTNCVNLICAVVSMIATLLIGSFQIYQNRRVRKLEERQDRRDEERHNECVKAQANTFITKYYNMRDLIPLCAIAAMYNDIFCFSRPMYREFCCFTEETQNTILKFVKLDLRVEKSKFSFTNIFDKFKRNIADNFPKEANTLFYDNGKYFVRSIERYNDKAIPKDKVLNGTYYAERITDVLASAFQDSNRVTRCPIEELIELYNFRYVPEIDACKFATVVAYFLAIYSDEGVDCEYECDYGYPGDSHYNNIESMEDLFLVALHAMYVSQIKAE